VSYIIDKIHALISLSKTKEQEDAKNIEALSVGNDKLT
jgi:hypothetical protein